MTPHVGRRPADRPEAASSTSSAPCCRPPASGLIVLGVLQSSTLGLDPAEGGSPVEPFGFSLTLFVIGSVAVLLWAFVGWQRHRERPGRDPLVHLDLLKIPPLRSGLIGLFTQNLILMGVFFTIPLYLQLVLGLDALETGLKMLPGVDRHVPRVRGGVAPVDPLPGPVDRAGRPRSRWSPPCVLLLATIQPDLADSRFASSMAVLGVGMGLHRLAARQRRAVLGRRLGAR